MNFSAKDLCSKSAMQIIYLRDNPNKRVVSQNMIDGSKYQSNVFNTTPNALHSEMVGHYDCIIDGIDINIYFSNDIITDNSIIEVKHVNVDYEEWYLENSLLQCAFYKSMIMVKSRILKTASFVNEPKKEINVKGDIDYYLKFGDKTFKIEVLNPHFIIGFFTCKAEHTMNYEDAKKFDEMYKGKEFKLLSKAFNYYECK